MRAFLRHTLPARWNIWNLVLQKGSEAALLKPTGAKHLKRAGDVSRYFWFCSLSKLIEARFYSNVINGWGYRLHWSEGQPLPLMRYSQYLIKKVPCLKVRRKKDLQRLKPRDGFLHGKHRQKPKYAREEWIIWNCNSQLAFLPQLCQWDPLSFM